MTLYIQHGHGKSTKITEAFDDGVAGGVIFAARNERVDKLDAYIEKLREGYDNLDVLFDPQFYVSTLVPANDRYLSEEYPYYQPGRTASSFIGPSKLSEFAKSTLDFQCERDLDRLISPTVIANSLSDRWSQIALQLADASLEYHAGLPEPPPLLLSLVISEAALDSRQDVDTLLDTLTTWDTKGFYLVIVRDDPAYSQHFDPERLARLLYLVHILSARNDYEVVCGYSDFVGIPLTAVGATAFAAGWYHSLRQFHEKAFLKRKPGGQPTRLRYSSLPLLNSIMLSELESITEVGHLEEVLSGVPLDSVITDAPSPESSNWTGRLSERHHWQTLAAAIAEFGGQPQSDLESVIEYVRTARGLYTQVKGAGVPFERHIDGHHLSSWYRGIQSFRHEIGWD